MKLCWILLLLFCGASNAAIIKVSNVTDQNVRVEYPYGLFGQLSTRSVDLPAQKEKIIDTGLSDVTFVRFNTPTGVQEIKPGWDKHEIYKHARIYRGPQR